jgi:hypothetical protein
MSSSNAAAIRRRANIQVTPPAVNPPPAVNQQSVPSQQTGYSMQQVITTFDKRITKLEQLIGTGTNTNPITNETDNENNQLMEVVNEFNNRFEIIVTEINDLKDILIRLQAYTMDVNKTLVEERIHVLSDLDTNQLLSENNIQSDVIVDISENNV